MGNAIGMWLRRREIQRRNRQDQIKMLENIKNRDRNVH
ncbi:unnamed protein product [Tenebrio molitor]|nr:unnamed protein product [Tenebrio molitor]